MQPMKRHLESSVWIQQGFSCFRLNVLYFIHQTDFIQLDLEPQEKNIFICEIPDQTPRGFVYSLHPNGLTKLRSTS